MLSGAASYTSMWPTPTPRHTHSQGPGVWHPAECVFLRSSLKRWFSLISWSLWPSTISLISSNAPFSPLLALPLGYHHLFYLFSIPELALPSLGPSAFVFSNTLCPSLLCSSFHTFYSIFSVFFLGPLFFFNHFLSITHRLRGRWEAQGTESIRFWCHTLWLALTPWGKVCTCPFASDRWLAKIHLHLLLVGPDSLQETCVSISLYVHVCIFLHMEITYSR